MRASYPVCLFSPFSSNGYFACFVLPVLERRLWEGHTWRLLVSKTEGFYSWKIWSGYGHEPHGPVFFGKSK